MLSLMYIQYNYLRILRKQSLLTQADLAAILKLADYANISRWEIGIHTPNVEVLLVYHLLFEVPIESIFERQRKDLVQPTIERIKERVDLLRGLEPDPKLQARIEFLNKALNRLTA
jgi:transcriptional regulator with XRE-family HTH domain